MAASIFFSYSHKDESLRDQLETQLTMLRRQGLIEPWHDRRIVAGIDVGPAIDEALEQADIILFLASPDFLASQYCYGIEVRRAMQRHEAGEAHVIQVVLRPCEWQKAPFGRLLATPKDGLPVTKWPDRDEAFLDVVRAVRKVVETRFEHAETVPAGGASPGNQNAAPVIRTGNLRLTKRFSEHDRDRFLHDTFEYVARFFENSLSELQSRHSDIDCAYRRVDANTFTAAVYRNGSKDSSCTISMGGGWSVGNSIQYASNDAAQTGSFNESISVEHDDQQLFLRPLGMRRFYGSDDREPKLSMEGSSEFFWEILIEPLQRKT